jgi:cell shape-determining protein MreD
MTGLPIDILGISCLVYASLGHIVQQNFTRLSTTEKNSLVCALVLMVIFETSLRTIIVHGLAFTFGVALSVAKRQSKD